MADRDSGRGAFEKLTLAGIGVVALAAGRIDDVSDDLARRLGLDRDEVRAALADALETWRREARRVGEQTGDAAGRLVEELGVAPRGAVDDLELRVAQLEHRLKLLERSY